MKSKKPELTATQPGYTRPAGAARYCGISTRHLANLTAQRVVPSILLGKRCRLYRLADLDAALARLRE